MKFLYPTKTQRAQILHELKQNPFRLDTEISELVGIPAFRIRRIREAQGYPAYSHMTRRKHQIQEDLKAEPMTPDSVLAKKYNCAVASVKKYRSELGLPCAPRKTGRWVTRDGTLKCREMLLSGTTLPDTHIAKQCGISSTHVARQRDLLGIPRSSPSNRLTRKQTQEVPHDSQQPG